MKARVRTTRPVRAGFTLRALGVTVLLLGTAACDLFSGTGDQVWARVESTGFVLLPGEESPAGLIVARPAIGFAGGLQRNPPHGGAAIWQISDTTIVTATRPIRSILAHRVGHAVLRGSAGGLSDTANVTVIADSGAARLSVLSVYTGSGFTCAVRLDERILCWGSAWYGELGHGATRKFTATLSPVPLTTTVALHGLQLGWDHACALDALNRAWCWGVNLSKQIRDAQASNYSQPVLAVEGKSFSSIAPGGSLTCGLSNGQMACWGSRLRGIETFGTTRPLVSIHAGTQHVCAVDDSSHLWCRGDNLFGQLGVSTIAFSHELVEIDPGQEYVDVSPGSANTCGLTTEQTVRCWGYGENGELGTGDRRSSALPVDVPLPAAVAQISTGSQSSCALLVTNQVYCWGYNLRGAIGVGPPPIDPRSDDLVFASPVPIASTRGFKHVSAGRGAAACAISLSDVVYCWGKNLEGAVGAGRHETRQVWPEQSFFWTPTLVRSVVP